MTDFRVKQADDEKDPAKDRRYSNGANLGFEAKMFLAADKLRGSIDAAEYKHVVLGLIFLKYIDDVFQEAYAQIASDSAGDPEDRDEYSSRNVFWVPKQARWSGIDGLQSYAKNTSIGKRLDDAMAAIELENPSLKGVLPKDYNRPQLDKIRLGEIIDLVSTIGLGDSISRSKDLLGRVYEYFLGQFASQEGKKGGQFYTPQCVVRLLVRMMEPYAGRIFDPCCGSGGMFVQSEQFVLAHGGRADDVAIYGQESNFTTWRLAKMNLAIRGIDAEIRWNEAGSFINDEFPDLKADYVIANPPFNDSDWGGERLRDDKRWKYGVPSSSNANFAWIQHFIHHLSPQGIAGFVMANGALSTNVAGEGETRKALIEADLVDCVVSLPHQLFYSTAIAASLWFLARDKATKKFRDRRGEVLFIDARQLGMLTDRTHRELSPEEIELIVSTYTRWRSSKSSDLGYQNTPGFAASVTISDIRNHKYALVPGRYVGFARQVSSENQLERLRAQVYDIDERFEQAGAAATSARSIIAELLHG